MTEQELKTTRKAELAEKLEKAGEVVAKTVSENQDLKEKLRVVMSDSNYDLKEVKGEKEKISVALDKNKEALSDIRKAISVFIKVSGYEKQIDDANGRFGYRLELKDNKFTRLLKELHKISENPDGSIVHY